MTISRRRVLTGASAAAVAAVAVAGVPGAAMANGKGTEPIVSLWQERARLYAQLDRISEQCTAIEKTLPEWARTFSGIVIKVPGCQPKTCRSDQAIDQAVGWRGMPIRYLGYKDGQAEWRREEKLYRDGKVAELAKARQQYNAEHERSGLTDKEAEYDTIWHDIDRIEDQIADTQAVTVDGLLVQALFCAELEKDNEPRFFTTRLGKSMGIAARRMAPGLAQDERLAGGMQP